MQLLIVTYQAPMPETADAGPLLRGRVHQVSTMTLDALIPRIRDMPLDSALLCGCNMAFLFGRHVREDKIWVSTVLRYESAFSRTLARLIADFWGARRCAGVPWAHVVVRCPFDCDECEEHLDGKEEGIIGPRLELWGHHMLRWGRAFKHVQWLRRVTARCWVYGRSLMQCGCPRGLDAVLANLQAVPEYIASHTDASRKQKVEYFLEVVCHEIFLV